MYQKSGPGKDHVYHDGPFKLPWSPESGIFPAGEKHGVRNRHRQCSWNAFGRAIQVRSAAGTILLEINPWSACGEGESLPWWASAMVLESPLTGRQE